MPLYNSPLGAAQAGVDGIMFGFTNNPSENFDAFLVTSIRDFLFREGEEENGLDLMALNIQRGRDHGIGCEYDYSPFVIRPNFYTTRFLYTIVCRRTCTWLSPRTGHKPVHYIIVFLPSA